MIWSHEFYFITSYETSSYENEIPLLKLLSVYSAVSKNFQQEHTTGCCGQIYVYLLLHVQLQWSKKKIPNNSLLTAAKTTDVHVEQENITSIYSIIAYYNIRRKQAMG